jgi:hypothetical protein
MRRCLCDGLRAATVTGRAHTAAGQAAPPVASATDSAPAATTAAAAAAAAGGCAVGALAASRRGPPAPAARKGRRPAPLLAGQQRISAASFLKPSGASRSPPRKRAHLRASSPSAPPPALSPTARAPLAASLKSAAAPAPAARLLVGGAGRAASGLVSIGQRAPRPGFLLLRRPTSPIPAGSNISSSSTNSTSTSTSSTSSTSLDWDASSTVTSESAGSSSSSSEISGTRTWPSSTGQGAARSPLRDISSMQPPLRQRAPAPANEKKATFQTAGLQPAVHSTVAPTARVFSDD